MKLEPAATFGGLGRMPHVVGVIDNSAGLPLDPRFGGHERLALAEPMVQCADGQVRRFPPGGHDYVAGRLIHDIPSARVTQRFGGFAMSQDGQHAAFMVDEFAVSPIEIGSFKAYPMPGNRFMVPQPGAKDCSNACELMLLLDHGKVSVDDAQYHSSGLGERRTTESVVASIEEHTGVPPVRVKHELNYKSSLFGGAHESRKTAWRDLAAKIAEMGPCILTKGGHDVMLDAVREENGKFFLSIRDPFHGTSMEFQDAEDFFPKSSNSRHHIDAVFMGKSAVQP